MDVITQKIQNRGVVTLPKRLRVSLGITEGSLVDMSEQNGGILIKPVSRLDPSLAEDLKNALNDLKTGNYIEFSSIEEFHKKRKAKWHRKA